MKIVFLVILNVILHVNSEAMNILRDGQVTAHGAKLILSDTNSFPLPNTEAYWLINQTNPRVEFNFSLQASNYSYLVSTIEIQVFSGKNELCEQESAVDVREYLVRFKVKSETRQVRLSSYPVTISGDLISVAINSSFPADSIEIFRNLDTSDQYCMRYGLFGTEIAQISVISYDMTAPNLAADSEYTGLCNDVMCFGGKGRLTNEARGSLNNLGNTGVSWSCLEKESDSCTFILNFIFSSLANINIIRLIGFRGGQFVIPTVTLQNTMESPPVTTLEASRQFVDQDMAQFILQVALESSTDELVISMRIPSGNNLVITEVEIMTSEDVNIGTRDVGYTFTTQSLVANTMADEDVTSTEPESSTIPTLQQNSTTQFIMTSQPELSTTETLQQNSTTQSTMMSSTNTTDADPNTEREFITRSNFFTVLGVLVIIIIMLILNSIIVIAWLAKSKQTTKKMLREIQNSRNANEQYFYHSRHPTNVTVLENISHRYGQDIYDSLNPPQEAYNADHTQTLQDMTHSITNHSIMSGSQITDVPMSSLHSSNHMELSVPVGNNNIANYATIQAPVMTSSLAKPEIRCDDIYQEPTFELPEIVIEENVDHQKSIKTSLRPNVPTINIQEFQQIPKDDDELSVLMEDNVAYKSPKRTNSTSSMDDDELGVPMTGNVGYVATNSLCAPSKSESCDIKQIYSSINEGRFFMQVPDKGNGDFTSYNVLKHK